MKRLRGPIQCRVELGQEMKREIEDSFYTGIKFVGIHKMKKLVQILKLQVVWDHTKGPTVTQPNLWTTTNPFTITLKLHVHHRACLIGYSYILLQAQKEACHKAHHS